MMEGIYKEMHAKGYRLIRGSWATPDELEVEVKKLESQLATQTERVRRLTEALEDIACKRPWKPHLRAGEALKQESLGDGKDEYCTCGTNPITWKTCRRHKEANESLGDGK